MSDRAEILGKLPDATPAPFESFPADFAGFESSVEPAIMWSMFAVQLEALGGRVIEDVEGKDWLSKRRWCDPILGLENTADSIWTAEVGFSAAVAAIAKSGTLIVEAGPEVERRSSLIPPVNVVLVPRTAIVPTLNEALAALSDRTAVFITGPSRTADIEGVMVRGVHGPGQLLVWVKDQ